MISSQASALPMLAIVVRVELPPSLERAVLALADALLARPPVAEPAPCAPQPAPADPAAFGAPAESEDLLATTAATDAPAAASYAGTPPAPPATAAAPPIRTRRSRRPAASAIEQWSDARVAYLRREWLGLRPTRELLPELNALAGPPLRAEQVYYQAKKLGLPRRDAIAIAGIAVKGTRYAAGPAPEPASPEPVPAGPIAGLVDPTEDPPGAIDDDAAAQAPPLPTTEPMSPAVAAPPPAPAPQLERWSDQRLELLRERCREGGELDELTDRLNSLPGAVLDRTWVRAKIHFLGLRLRPSAVTARPEPAGTLPRSAAPATAHPSLPWPPERLAIVVRGARAARDAADMLDEINAVPGPRLTLRQIEAKLADTHRLVQVQAAAA